MPRGETYEETWQSCKTSLGTKTGTRNSEVRVRNSVTRGFVKSTERKPIQQMGTNSNRLNREGQKGKKHGPVLDVKRPRKLNKLWRGYTWHCSQEVLARYKQQMNTVKIRKEEQRNLKILIVDNVDENFKLQ